MVKATVSLLAESKELLVEIINQIKKGYPHSVAMDPRRNTRPPMEQGWRCVVYVEVA
jgi:hypothetical protein